MKVALIIQLFLVVVLSVNARANKKDKGKGKNGGDPTPTPAPAECEEGTMQVVKVALAWDYALCQWVNEDEGWSPDGNDTASTICLDAAGDYDIEITNCYAKSILAQANVAFNAVDLCVDLRATIYPDSGCSKTTSYYEDIDVTQTAGSDGLWNKFIDAGAFGAEGASKDAVKHILAGSDVGNNIGYAYYNTLCHPNPNLGGATWVRGNHWEYFAHELGHQLGVDDHVKGKEAKDGNYIMENFVKDGVFAPSSKLLLKTFIESKVEITGTCRTR